MLTQERVKELFDYDEDLGELIRRTTVTSGKAGTAVGGVRVSPSGRVGLRCDVDGKKYTLTHIIWLWKTGALPPKTMQIDHIDREPFNNTWGNLRLVTPQDNSRNRNATRGRHLKGVYQKPSGRFVGQIKVNNKSKYLGTYRTEIEAHNAYCEAAEAEYGEFFSPA